MPKALSERTRREREQARLRRLLARCARQWVLEGHVPFEAAELERVVAAALPERIAKLPHREDAQ